METVAAVLTLSATSSDESVVPAANIVFSGSGADRTATITPALNAFGAATITITVHDANGGIASDSFVLAVKFVDDAPTISDIVHTNTDEEMAQNVNLTVGGIVNESELLPLDSYALRESQ